MGFWSVILPLATINLISNPSFEVDTTGWTAVGGSVARSTSYSKWGTASLAITPTAGTTDGAYFGTVALTSGITYTFSVWVRGVLNIPYKIYFANTSGTLKGTATTFTATGAWQRIEVSWACDSSTTYRLYVTKNTDASTGVIYTDGAMCEAQTAATTYCDGGQGGCTWDSTPHVSTSRRSAQSRAGGQIVNLDTLGLYITGTPGIGMPPIEHITQEQVFQPGAKFIGTKVLPRVFTLIGEQIGTTWPNLHALRKALIDALKPDRVGEEQPILLRYSGGAEVVETPVVYDSGLEFGETQGFSEEQPIRLIGYDPFWYAIGESSQALTVESSVTVRNVIGRIGGLWNVMGPASSGGEIYDICGDSQYIYICGSFTNWNGISAADYIARYTKSSGAWSALGTGADGVINGMCIASVGSGSPALYVTGDFANIGGVAAARIAKWDGTNWTALGTGLGAMGVDVIDGQNGCLYVGGAFATAGGVTVNHIAKWDGTNWTALGATPGVDGAVGHQVNALAINKAGALVIGGDFTSAGGTTVSYVAQWNGTSWARMGSETLGIVYGLAAAPDGGMYLGCAAASYYIAKYNSRAWGPLSPLPGAAAWRMALDSRGDLYVTGAFTAIGGVPLADRVAVWNGSSWSQLDVDLPGAGNLSGIFVDANDDLYIGGNFDGTAVWAYGVNTVTNSGSRKSYPVITIARSGGTSATLAAIRNLETGKSLLFNYNLAGGETLTIDLRPGHRTITSSLYGKVWRAMQRGSNFASFTLLPGSNTIQAMVLTAGTPTITASIVWRTTNWGADN